ncbi:MAG: hypothetical protein ACREFI_03480 [Stellaceae bacterium]
MTARLPHSNKTILELGRATLVGLALLALVAPASRALAQADAGIRRTLSEPIWVYNDWSAYDELSDEVPLNEPLAMRELDEMLRLRKAGVHFDYYMMDAFWYDPEGGYRTWRREDWPDGPDRWIAACEAAGIKPGLWFSSNTLTKISAAPQWLSSLNASGTEMALYTGGFLDDFMSVLEYWYGRGVRMFKLDFADFGAAAKGDEHRLAPQTIRLRNARALHGALRAFRQKHPDVVLVAFNGYVGEIESAAATLNPFNVTWLDTFDSLYAGDPRPSDLPEMDLWRAIDIYSDDMVRHFAQNGVPLERVDSTAFMVGNTGTNYYRKTGAWRGSLLLMVARGGWINTVHGNLEYLDDEEARWFARVQDLYAPLQKSGVTRWFGGNPGSAWPYGFGSEGKDGALYAVVNPAQGIRELRLPRLSPAQEPNVEGRVLFRDAGFTPVLEGDTIRLGPGQLALVGFGRYSSATYDLGIETDIRIPERIKLVPAHFRDVEEPGLDHLAVEAEIAPPKRGDLRIILQQRDPDGSVVRSTSNGPMGKFFVIRASQAGKELPVEVRYDTVIWSGLSWGVGELRHDQWTSGKPIHIELSSAERDPEIHLDGRVYRVEY